MWFPIWHRSTGSHREASVHCLHGARAADIKTLLMFLAGNLQIFSNSPLPTRGTNDLRLSAVIIGAASSACFTKPWKKWASKPIFSGVSKVGVEIVGSRFFFFENHRLPSCCSNNKLNFQDLPEALLLSTNTQRGLNLDTYHSPLLFKPCIPRLPKTPDPWITPCFHSNRSGATLFRCVI